jgi:hypothetical protein
MKVLPKYGKEVMEIEEEDEEEQGSKRMMD